MFFFSFFLKGDYGIFCSIQILRFLKTCLEKQEGKISRLDSFIDVEAILPTTTAKIPSIFWTHESLRVIKRLFFFSLFGLSWHGLLLYSLKSLQKKKIVAHRQCFFFLFFFGGFDWFLLRFTSSVPAFRRRHYRRHFLYCWCKKKNIRETMGLFCLNHVRSVTFIMPVRHKCKNNLSVFFLLCSFRWPL